MNSRREFPQDRFGRGRDDHGRSFSRERAPYGAGQDRFGGPDSRRMDYGNPYETGGPSDWSRQNAWDEDRFGYPESSYGQGGGPQGRFAEDRYSWGREYGGHDDQRRPRHFEPRQSSGLGRGSSSDRGGMFGGWGIPSGSELGGYDMNSPDRGGPHNWSGSNWGNQDHGGHWGERHSGRFAGTRSDAFGDREMRGRVPKGYARSDERIRDDVCEQLYRTPDLDVGDVSVEARNGIVTLEGTVPDRRMKHRIEDLCDQCLGVQDVENRIRVRRQDQGDGSRMASSPSPQMDLSMATPSVGSRTSATGERPGKKSTTGGSSSQH